MSKYSYTALPGRLGPIYKPFIPVTLEYKKTRKITSAVYALVDSGADVCFCMENIAFWLGYRKKEKLSITFTTANKTTFSAVKALFTLHVADKRYECPMYISKDLPPETPIILGQLGFFDHFKILFDLPEREITIT